MSNLTSSTNIKDYISTVLAANVHWAQRLNQTFPQYFPDPKDKQAPKILWIGCSDSRAQESDATTALPGTVFVHRNIANQFHLNDDNALSVFAYAIKELVVVVGHEHCGGAIAALKEATEPSSKDKIKHQHIPPHQPIESLHRRQPNNVRDNNSKNPNDAITRWLTPLVNRIKELSLPVEDDAALRMVIEENVNLQVKNIVQLKEWVRNNAGTDKKPIWVHGWVYDFSTGFIRDLEITKELGSCPV